MPYDWEPSVEEITPHLHRWLEGTPSDAQTDALEAFVTEAAAEVAAEVASDIPEAFESMASVATRRLVAYWYVRSWHPEEDDLLRERYHDDYVEALDRLKKALDTSDDTNRRTYGSVFAGGPALRAARNLGLIE